MDLSSSDVPSTVARGPVAQVRRERTTTDSEEGDGGAKVAARSNKDSLRCAQLTSYHNISQWLFKNKHNTGPEKVYNNSF